MGIYIKDERGYCAGGARIGSHGALPLASLIVPSSAAPAGGLARRTPCILIDLDEPGIGAAPRSIAA